MDAGVAKSKHVDGHVTATVDVSSHVIKICKITSVSWGEFFWDTIGVEERSLRREKVWGVKKNHDKREREAPTA